MFSDASCAGRIHVLPRSDMVSTGGRYGEYGGRFVSETLVPALVELERAFEDVAKSDTFVREWRALLAS